VKVHLDEVDKCGEDLQVALDGLNALATLAPKIEELSSVVSYAAFFTTYPPPLPPHLPFFRSSLPAAFVLLPSPLSLFPRLGPSRTYARVMLGVQNGRRLGQRLIDH
jgi:hypothetical protein